MLSGVESCRLCQTFAGRKIGQEGKEICEESRQEEALLHNVVSQVSNFHKESGQNIPLMNRPFLLTLRVGVMGSLLPASVAASPATLVDRPKAGMSFWS